MSESRIGDEPESVIQSRAAAILEKADVRDRFERYAQRIVAEVHASGVDPAVATVAWYVWERMGRALARITPEGTLYHVSGGLLGAETLRLSREQAGAMSVAGVQHARGMDQVPATESGDRAPAMSEESAEEQLAAGAVDRMIAHLETATATVEAQLAELRRMRRAA